VGDHSKRIEILKSSGDWPRIQPDDSGRGNVSTSEIICQEAVTVDLYRVVTMTGFCSPRVVLLSQRRAGEISLPESALDVTSDVVHHREGCEGSELLAKSAWVIGAGETERRDFAASLNHAFAILPKLATLLVGMNDKSG